MTARAHSYLHISHSLSFTTVKCLSLFIIYKIAGDFERFSAQALVLEWHKGAEEEEDAESPTPVPKSLPWCPSDAQLGASLPIPHGSLHWWSPFPSHPEQASDSIISPVMMEKGSHLCGNTPGGRWHHQRGASVAFCSVSHTNCSSYEEQARGFLSQVWQLHTYLTQKQSLGKLLNRNPETAIRNLNGC